MGSSSPLESALGTTDIQTIFDLPGNQALAANLIQGEIDYYLYEGGMVWRTTGDNGGFDYKVFDYTSFLYDSIMDPVTIPADNIWLDFTTDFFNSAPVDMRFDGSAVDWVDGYFMYGGNYQGLMDSGILNANGFYNVLPSSIVTDDYRPGADTLWGMDALFDLFDNAVDIIWGETSSYDGGGNIYYDTLIGSGASSLALLWAGLDLWLNIDPVALDMDGDGVELVSYVGSTAAFDVDNDGYVEKTGWVAADDALLVHDIDGSGTIDDITETLSAFYNGGSYAHGIEALKTLDGNSDGVFDANDAAYASLGVWRDSNQNGITDAGELATLAAAGVTAVDLAGADDIERQELEGNPVLSRTTMTINGQTQDVAAVDFATNPAGYEWNDVAEGVEIATEGAAASALVMGDTTGGTIDMATQGVNAVIGNIGDDTITGTSGDDWMMGAAGSDTMSGGDGNDMLIIDAEDDLANIDAGAGFDVVQVAGDRGVILNMTDINAEVVLGGVGRDVLMSGGNTNAFIRGGAGDDVIIGGSADDALSGEDGDDTVDGALGDDILRGHRGEDTLIGGDGEDYLDGGLDDDALYAGAGEDLLIGGAGNDHLFGGADYDVAQFSGNVDEYSVTILSAGVIQVKDLVAGRDGTDILEDVEALNFKNILEVPVDQAAPIVSNDVISISGAGPYTISAASILANDLDYQGQALSITGVADVKGGAAYVDGNGDVVFTPDADYQGVRSFKYTIEDSEDNAGMTALNLYNQQTAETRGVVYLQEANHPDDPLFYDQWYLSDINVVPVWDDYTGEGVKVGLYEPGVMDAWHPDLVDNASQKSLDGIHIEFADGATLYQLSGVESQHSTQVAGVLGASGDNGEGGIGVAYNVTLEARTIEVEGFDQQVLIFDYAEYDVVNNSWGYTGPFYGSLNGDDFADTYLQEGLVPAVHDGRDGLGTIIVSGGGNSREDGLDTNVSPLTNSQYTITVGGINKDADLSTLEVYQTPFSNHGANILVSAPASHVTSTSALLENAQGSTFGNDYEVTQGTSFATPIVSGVVALMLEANPDLGWRDVQEILAYSARNVDDSTTNWQENGASNWNGGGLHFSHDYGFGNVDALAAVRLAETWGKQETVSDQITSTPGTFVGNLSNATITDNGTITDTITITGTGFRLEHVSLTLDFTHPRTGDLIVTLTSPDGTESIILNRLGKAPDDAQDTGYGALDTTYTFGSRAYMGEVANGDWTLEITDTLTGEVGTLRSWSLDFAGELYPQNNTYIYTNEFADVATAARQTLEDANDGDDILNAAAVTGDVDIDLTPGQVSDLNGTDLTIASGTVIERAFAGDGDDSLTGNTANNLLYGGRGDDLIDGGDGNDWLLGKVGNNSLTGGTGRDYFIVQYGDAGEHAIQDLNAGQGDKILIANYEGISGVADMTLVQEGSDTRVTLPNGEEILVVGVLPSALSDADFIFDADFSFKDVKLEEAIGTSGDDLLYVTPGTDTHYLMKSLDGDDEIYGSYGDDIIYGGNGNDILVGSPNTADPDGGSDRLYGEAGNDALYGGGQQDVLDGGEGDDFMSGNDMNDLIHHEGGFDQSYGGNGNDTFVIHEASAVAIAQGSSQWMDLIWDFDPTQDRLDVTAFGTNSLDNLDFTEVTIDVSGTLTDSLVVYTNPAVNAQYVTLIGVASEDDLSYQNFVFVNPNQPKPLKDSFTIDEDQTLNFTVDDITANDIDASWVLIYNGIIDGPDHGTLSYDGSGNYTYTPDADYFGVDTLIYEVEDADGVSATTSVTININPVEDAPDVSVLPGAILAKTGSLFSYIPDAVDPDGDVLAYAVTLDDGSALPAWLTFDPNTNRLSGTSPLTPETLDLKLTASDGTTSVDHFFSLNITSRAPLAKGDAFTVDEDAQLAGNVIADNGNGVDSDPDGDSLSVEASGITTTYGGSVSMSSNGSFTYMPTADFNGTDKFYYTLLDDQGGSSLGLATIAVNPVNDDPVGTDDAFSGYLNQQVTGNLLVDNGNGLDSDIDEDTLSVQAETVSTTEGGSVTISSNGDFVFTPDTDFTGMDSFSYTLLDGQGGNDIVTVDIYVLEAIVGTSGNDTLSGTVLNDVILGFDGNDTLDGDTGADTLVGGTGDDIYIVDDASDVLTESTSEGTDSVQSSISYTLPDNVENLTLTGTGNVNGAGNPLGNTIAGNSGDNYLDGGSGADTMSGGAGNDIYIVDNTGDIVTESASEGTDTIQSSVTDTLSSNVENLTLTGASNTNGFGNTLDNTLTGNAGDNSLSGSSGNDTLYGGTGNDGLTGGSGNDNLYGEDGDDTFSAGSGDDLLNGGNGTDTATYAAYTNAVTVNLTTGIQTGAGTDTLISIENILGSANNDTLTGSSVANVIDGGGGADTMAGGDGDDTYYVDNTGDVISETAAGGGNAGGIDTVYASVSYTLAGFVNNLVLTGSSNLNGTGNNSDNILTGNSGNNTLTASGGNDTLDGGAGADSMAGGTGNDVYYVDSSSDTVTEASAAGTDTVNSVITHTLASNVENLILTGAGNINGFGNTLDNVLTGNAGNNSLSGSSGNDTIYAGAGNDALTGGSGNDNLYGEDGDDTFSPGSGDDLLDGGSGIDTADYSAFTGAVTVNLTTGVQTGTGTDTLVGIENILGSANNDTLTGNSAANVIDGGAGTDTMAGGDGDDTYYVDNTGDVISETAAGGGNAGGIDTVYASVSYTLAGFVNHLTLTGGSNLNGTGNNSANILTGNGGNNTLTGSGGNDTLHGGGGLDTLWGGADADTFVFEAASAYNNIDVVKDFSTAQSDVLNISNLLDLYDPLNDAITDFVQIATNGANSTLSVDRDGAGSTYGWQQIATLEGITGITDEAALVTAGNLIVTS